MTNEKKGVFRPPKWMVYHGFKHVLHRFQNDDAHFPWHFGDPGTFGGGQVGTINHGLSCGLDRQVVLGNLPSGCGLPGAVGHGSGFSGTLVIE